MTEPTRAAGGGVERVRVLGEHGLSRAADAISRMLGCRLRLMLTEVHSPASRAVPPWTTDVERPSVALLRVSVGGDGHGRILILLPVHALHRILHALLGTTGEAGELTEIGRSAVQEFGNLLASSFLSEVGDRLGRRLLPSPPALSLGDTAPSVGDTGAWGRIPDPGAWVIEACLTTPEGGLEGQVWIVLDDGALAPVTGGPERTRRVCT